MWTSVIVGGLLCLSLTGGSRRVEKPLRSPAEENKRLYLQHFFGEDGHEEPTRKGGSTMFAAQQSYTYPRSGGGGRNGGVQEFSPKRSKPRKPGAGGAFNHDHSMSQLPRERKPNIILILTDDQDVELGSLNFMPRTQRLLRNEGAEFRHAYVTTPMCCPSRSSMLTGMLVHNHQVFTNNDNCSGTAWQATHETRSFATYLSNAGYRTGYIGKYLNKYNGSYIPPGWREWAGLIMNSRYYNYSINVNGKRIKHGADYHRDYYPDLIANDSIAFLRQSKQSFSRKPVMLVMSFPAPHGPEDSAPQYSHLFFNVTTHHTPSYDYAPNPDKQWILRVTGRMQPIHKRFTDMLMTKRLQTLQSVDAAVQRVYDALDELGELENTYIVYTSDHGYHLGQFGLVKGKSFPFEFDIRVPFLVRGPGVEPGTIVDDIVLNVDLAPTFLDIAGVEPPAHMDGRSLLPLLHRGHKQPRRRRSRWPDTFLVESSGRREIPSRDNKVGEGVHSKVARLNRECLLPAFQHPCKPGQKWTCVKEEGRWRKHKCKFIKHPPPPPPPALIGSESTWGTSSMFKAQMGRRRCTCFPPSLELPVMHPHPLLARLDQEERRMQRNFLRTHLSPQHEPYKPRFLKQPSLVRRRRRRSVGHLADSLDDLWSLGDENEGGVRQRRSLSALLDSLLGGVSQQLKGLEQQSNDTSEEDAESEQGALGNGTVVERAKCRVMGAGQVNCSRAVYKNSKVWRQSKQHIDEQINKLRDQLEALKEIRRHLRHKRPPPRTHGEDGEDNQSSSEEDLSSEDDPEEEEEEELEEEEEEEEEEYPDTTLPPQPEVTTKSSSTTGQPVTSTFRPATTTSTPGFVERTTSAYPEMTTAGYNHTDLSSTVATSVFPAPPIVRPLGSSKLGTTLHHDKHGNVCICEPDPILEARRRQKEQRLRRKERKMRRKARMESECLSEKMNCFTHDNSHWRTAPLWTDGPFCVCMNANNNTYSCLRTINATHNFLFCEFTTGLITYYNLRIDPFEQNNRAHALSSGELEALRAQLKQLKGCRGARECRTASPPPPVHTQQSTQEQDTVPPPEQHQQGRRRSKTGGKQNFERLRHRQDHTYEPPF